MAVVHTLHNSCASSSLAKLLIQELLCFPNSILEVDLHHHSIQLPVCQPHSQGLRTYKYSTGFIRLPVPPYGYPEITYWQPCSSNQSKVGGVPLTIKWDSARTFLKCFRNNPLPDPYIPYLCFQNSNYAWLVVQRFLIYFMSADTIWVTCT